MAIMAMLDAISCWCWLPPVAAEAGSVRVRGVMSWDRGPGAGYLMTSPAQLRPDTIFKGCSMLIVPGTRQPTQCTAVKMPAHKLSLSSKVRWQHWWCGASGGHYNVITAGINPADEVYRDQNRGYNETFFLFKALLWTDLFADHFRYGQNHLWPHGVFPNSHQ